MVTPTCSTCECYRPVEVGEVAEGQVEEEVEVRMEVEVKVEQETPPPPTLTEREFSLL